MALTQVNQGLLSTDAQYTGFKNRIINGAMMIDQRNAGASVSSNDAYTLDRWKDSVSATGKFTIQQNAGSVTPPSGFKNYLGVTSTAATSVGSGDYYVLDQSIEGYNISDLGWGASGASAITISFWVRSSLTGTFGCSIRNSGANYSYPFTYTISVANTWEQKSVTIAGPTAGTWLTSNSTGLRLFFGLGVGSSFSGTAGSWSATNYLGATGATSVVGTNGATFYITGVQLEKGSTATSFDYRPYGTELQLCQRYCQYYRAAASGLGVILGAGGQTGPQNAWFYHSIKVTMRTLPTLTYADLIISDSTSYDLPINLISSLTGTGDGVYIATSSASSGTTYRPVNMRFNSTSAYFALSAEL